MKRDKSGTLKPLEILHKEKKQTRTRRPRRLTMDLSTRKRMEEELRESEERYRILFEQFADPVALVDPETMRILECNDKTPELLGYSRKELSSMKITDLDVVESGEEVFSHAKKIIHKGTDKFETKKKCKNGAIRDIEVTARAVSLHGKNVILVIWRDITGYKRTQDALRESEERFRMLVEKSTMGIGISCGKQVIFANTALLRMFGYDNLEEFTGIPLLNHVAPAFYEQIVKRMERVAQGKPVPKEFEYDILRKDGLVRTLRASSSHFTVQDKTYSQTTFQDITESRLAQEALKQSETKYRELIENLNDVIFSVDTTGKILYISPSVTHITGYTPEEITGRNLFDFFSQEERNRYGEQMQRTVNIGSSIGEFTITVKDQSTKWIRASSRCVKENGTVAAIRGVMSDITGRKQAEQALAESEKKYRTLVETVGDAIVLTDLNGRHLFTNSAYHTSLGYETDRDPCPDGFSIVHPDDLPFVKSSMAELLKRGTMTGEYRARHKDGFWIHRYSISTLIKNKSGEPEAILTVIRDITDRKRAEAIVRQSETRYRELFDNISSGVAIYTVIDDGKDFVFVDFNKAGERIDGDRREDLIGKSIFEARPGIEQFGLLEVFRRVWQTGVPEHYPVTQYKDNRLQGWYENFVYRLPTGEIVAVFDNLTERKKAEEHAQIERNLSIALSVVSDLSTGMELCLESAIRISNMDCGGIYLLNPDTKDLDLKSHKGFSARFIKSVSRYPSDSPNTRLILSGKSIFINYQQLPVPKDEMRVKEGLRAIAIIPFSRDNRVIGCLNVASHTIDEMSSESILRLETISALIGNVLGRMLAEEGLRLSEERYRRLLASVSGYVYSVEVRDGIPFHTVHGSGCEAITGYTSEDYERDPNLWITMVHHDDRALVEEQADRILASADPVTMEHRIIHKNGSIRWIRNTLVPHIDAQGTLISYDGIVSDISERILAQQELSDAEEKFRSLAEQSTEGILLTDQNMKIIEWNMAQERIFGFSRDEMVGLALWDFQHMVLPEEMKKEISPQLMRARMEQLIDTQGPLWSPSVMEYSIHTGQGKEKLVQVTAFPIKRREGIMYCAITRDITAARKAELQIHESEQRFRQFADNVDEVFGIFDVASQQALYVSAAYEKIWGRKADALYQNLHIWMEAVLPEDREIVIKGSLGSPESANIEFRISRPDGQVRWIRFRTFPIRNKQGIVYRIAGIAADITEFKNAAQQAQLHQQQLIMADKMASLGVLVSGVAHEINNPNNFIMLNAPILRDAWLDAQKILDAYHKEKGDFPIAQMNYSEMAANIVPLLDGIQRGAESIQRIVSNLKDYSRQDAYDQLSEVDANAIVNSAVSLLKNMVKKSTKNFTLNLHPEPLLLQGNFQRLGQVVVNLIQNACDALTDPAQGIQVSTGRVAATDAVSIVVRDEGVGIEPEFISKVTDPFFTTKRDKGGTGLGLSISAGIVKDHGGEIRFESTPGKGTTVTVTLPGKGHFNGKT